MKYIFQYENPYASTAFHRLFRHKLFANVFPNPANEILIIQAIGLVNKDIQIELYDIKGNIVSKTKVLQGSTIAFIDVQTLYSGTYFIKMINQNTVQTKKIIIQKDME